MELEMDSSAIPVYMAGPFPVVYSSGVNDIEQEIELDVALLIDWPQGSGGLPNIVASTAFPNDETWDRIRHALESGDAKLGVAGVLYEEESTLGSELYPSAYIGLECANGERLVLSHIRGLEPGRNAEAYAREVIDSILNGLTPEELGVVLDD
jgi:hypothetical protein